MQSPWRQQNRFDIEIGTRAPPRNFVRLIGRADVQRHRVIRWMDSDGGKVGFASGAGDANGYLAPIGDQEFMHDCIH
jgi:hypothetical protein